MPKVSVVIPVYNSEKYLEKCLTSVLGQSFINEMEIICVLNGSTDKSKEILFTYGKRIRILELKEASIGAARNEGVRAARGQFILFFDSDDYMEPNMCSELCNYAIANNVDLVTSDYFQEIENGPKKKIVRTYSFNITNIYGDKKLLYKLNLGPVKLFRREIIVKYEILFPKELKYEDIYYLAVYLKYCNQIGKVKLPLFNYVIHENSEQTTMDERIVDALEIMKRVNKYYEYDDVLQESLMSLNVKTLLTYALKQKMQQDRSIKSKFIDDVFEYLNTTFPKWKSCEYLKEKVWFKRYVMKRKGLVKLYCK